MPVPTGAIICHKQKYRGPLHISGKDSSLGGTDFIGVTITSVHKDEVHIKSNGTKYTNIYKYMLIST